MIRWWLIVRINRSFYRLQRHREWCLPGTAWLLVWSILQRPGSQRKKDCHRSGRTTVAGMQLMDRQWNFPLWFATCTLRHRWRAPFHDSWFCWWSQWGRHSFHCGLLPIRILCWDWSRHRSTPFRRGWRGWLPPFDLPELMLIFLCRGTCRCLWWGLQRERCWDCWWCLHQHLHMSNSRELWQMNTRCSSCIDRWRWRRADWHPHPKCTVRRL